MPLQFVSGDPLLTRAQVLAFGHNRKGRTEMGALQTELMRRFPAAFATYTRQCKRGRIDTGGYWIWRESTPYLMFMTVRDSSVGATRLRYVQSVALKLARDFRLENLTSVAIAQVGDSSEWPEIKLILETWLNQSTLNVIAYEDVIQGVQADEGV